MPLARASSKGKRLSSILLRSTEPELEHPPWPPTEAQLSATVLIACGLYDRLLSQGVVFVHRDGLYLLPYSETREIRPVWKL